MLRSRSLPLLPLLLACAAVPQTKPPPSQLTTPLEYFRRAKDLMNLRLPGSQPFSMRVLFQAYPGMDLTPPGKSTILAGHGVYQETWVSPEEWRREVTLGSYHAVEIRAGGKRTFQATSSYEPSRVMMLLGTVLTPIPRFLLEPEVEAHPTHWKLEHRTTGSISWVRISAGTPIPGVSLAFDFLPSGILVRIEGVGATSFDDDQSFADKIVPGHIAVQGPDGPRLSATVSISSLPPSERTIAQVPGAPADPGSTLQPIDPRSMDKPPREIHLQSPLLPPDHYPPGVEILATWIVDKSGMPRDAEISAVVDDGPPLSQQAKEVVWQTARLLIDSIRKDRFHPALIDGKPCQFGSAMTMGPPRTE
jgi:hypothetical protein